MENPLDHHELILLARLLGNHLINPADVVRSETHAKLDAISEKLLEYAERTGEFDPLSENRADNPKSLPPLDFRYVVFHHYPGRICFYVS